MKKTLTVICMSSLIYISCKKNDDNTSTISSGITYTNDKIFADLSLKPKQLKVTAETGGIYYGNSGTKYQFFPNSFILADGTIVTGDVDIAVTEYLLKGDMLFSKMLPISGGEPLMSGGEINVSASQNGKQVFLRPNNVFVATIPPTDSVPAGMKMFMGRTTTDTAVMKVDWMMVEPNVDRYMVNVFTISGSDGKDTLSIISDSLTLCNADRFMTSPNYQNFKVNVFVSGATLKNETVMGYTLYDNFKGIWPMAYTKNNHQFNENHIPDIPVHFVAFTIINGKFFGGITGATPKTNEEYTLTLTEQNPEEFKKTLNDM